MSVPPLNQETKFIENLDKLSLLSFFQTFFSRKKSGTYQVWSVVLMQVYFTYIQALPLLLLIAFGIGICSSLQANVGLSLVGAGDRLGEVWVYLIAREVAPLITAILVAARSGTAVASETATMKEQQEIAALEMMGISPTQFVFAPRIVAGIISNFCLANCFVVGSLFGTWVGANLIQELAFSDLIAKVIHTLIVDDMFFFILKTTIAGGGIFWLACKKGLALKKAAFEVPIMTIQAVVGAIGWALFIQVLLSVVFYTINGIEI